MWTGSAVISPLPGDGEEEGALFERFKVVGQVPVERQQMAGREFYLLARKAQLHAPCERVNGDSAVRVVLTEPGTALHDDEHESQVGLLDQRARVAVPSLPARFAF